jgi:hypothetical protein
MKLMEHQEGVSRSSGKQGMKKSRTLRGVGERKKEEKQQQQMSIMTLMFSMLLPQQPPFTPMVNANNANIYKTSH